jgi:hypothetical protein
MPLVLKRAPPFLSSCMPCVHVLLLTFHAGGASGVVFLGGMWNSETPNDSDQVTGLVAAHGV